MEHSQTSACAEHSTVPRDSGSNAHVHSNSGALSGPRPTSLAHALKQVPRQSAPEKTGYMKLSRTTDRVLQILLTGDLARLRADSVAESLGMSGTTLRRRLRADHTCYQFLLDRARQYRCEQSLSQNWLPGKCLADQLGYLEVNSFYRAFRRWTGMSYSDYKLQLGL